MPGQNDRDRANGCGDGGRWYLPWRPWWRPSDGLFLRRILILAIAYGGMAYLAVAIPGVHTMGASVWPSAGIAQALLLLWGWRVWPGICLGVYLFAWLHDGDPLPFVALIGTPGAVLQSLLAVWLFRRFKLNPRLRRLSDVMKLIGLGALGATQISCTLGALALVLDGDIPWSEMGSVRWSWWLGDTLGVIVFTPAVLVLGQNRTFRTLIRTLHRRLRYLGQGWQGPWQWQGRSPRVHFRSRLRAPVRLPKTRQVWLRWGWLVCLLGVSLFVFTNRPAEAIAYYPIEYLPLPFILWASLRLGYQETVLSAVLVSIIAIVGSSQGLGPFASKGIDKAQIILLLQAFLGVIVITALVMAAAVAERDGVMTSLRRSEQRYKQLSQELEKRVEQRTQELQEQQERSEALLLNILPQAIATQLKQHPNQTIAETFDQVTVLFADIVSFTEFAAAVPPQDLVSLLNRIISDFDRLTEQYGLEKIKTIGDEYMVVGGLPQPNPHQVIAMAELALAMQRNIQTHVRPDGVPFQLRIGIHCGSVVAGVIGVKKFAYDLWGVTVNLASRLETSSDPDTIQVSQAVYDQLSDAHLGDRFTLTLRGDIDLKGKGTTRTYWLLGGTASDPKSL